MNTTNRIPLNTGCSFNERLGAASAIILFVFLVVSLSDLRAEDAPASEANTAQAAFEPDLLTIAQYRALMERDLHRQRANEAMLRKDWPAVKAASLAAMKLEQQVYGADFAGEDLTRAALVLANLETGDVKAVIDLLTEADGPDQKEFLSQLIDGDQPREKTLEMFSLFIDLANDSAKPESLEATSLSKFERLNEFLQELGLLHMVPELSWRMANYYAVGKEWEKALTQARLAYRNGRSSRTAGGDEASKFVTFSGSLARLLQDTAADYESRNEWDKAIPLHRERLEIARELAQGVEPAERALARATRVAKMTGDERARLAAADTGMQSVWMNFGNQNVNAALDDTYAVRQTYQELLGADSDGYAYCTKVTGFLHFNLGEYDTAFDRLVLAAELLVKSRGPSDQLTQEAVSDACFSAYLAAANSTAPKQLAESVRRFETFVTENFGMQPQLVAAATVNRLYIDLVASLSNEQRAAFVRLFNRRAERNNLFAEGKYSQAALIADEIVSKMETLLGTGNHSFQEDLFSLANCQGMAEKFEAAEQNYRRLIDLSDREPFNQLPEFADRLRWFGSVLRSHGKIDAALDILRLTESATEASSGKRSAAYAHLLRVQAYIFTEDLYQPALALPLLIEATEILRETGSTENYDFAVAQSQLGECERMLLRHREAEQHFTDSLAICRRLPQIDLAAVALNMNGLGMIFVVTNRAEKAVEMFQQAISLKEQINPEANDLSSVYANLISAFLRNGDRKQANLWLTKLQATRRKNWGENDPRYADDLIALGSAVLARNGDFFQDVSKHEAEFIEPLFREAALIRSAVFGDSSWQYAEALQRQGCLLMYSGHTSDAILVFLEARAMAAACGQTAAKVQALVSTDLALAYVKSGDYVRALPIRLETTKAFRESYSNQSPYVASSLLATAQIYTTIGDIDRAEACTREAAEIFSRTGHDRQRECYIFLALLYLRSGDLDRAEQYLHFVKRMKQPATNSSSALDAAAELALVRLYFAREDYDQAIELAEQSLLTVQSTVNDPSTSINLQEMLGLALLRKAEFERAEELLNSVIDSRIEHASADPLANQRTFEALSELQERRGDPEGALRWARKSINLAEQHLASVSAVLSERQQLLIRATIRGSIDRYISLGLRSKLDVNELYSLVLRWKGGVFLRQRSIRDMLKDADEQTKQLADELTSINRQLSTSAFNSLGGSSADWSGSLKAMTDRKEVLEGQLAQLDVAFQPSTEQDQQRAIDLKERMPPDVVLVDFLTFTNDSSVADQTQRMRLGGDDRSAKEHLLMFVVSRDGPITVTDLGNTESISDDIQKWRLAVMNSRADKFESIGKRLRQTLWSAVEPRLTADKTVLISPDGALSQLAFGALPGRLDGTFLLEEYRLATISIPQLMFEQLGDETRPSGPAGDNLLLVGNIDFSGSSGEQQESVTSIAAPTRSLAGNRLLWPPLPGTQAEIESIQHTFEQHNEKSAVWTLTKSGATESALRNRVPDAGWLHFATHGFFADAGVIGTQNRTAASRSLEATVLGRESIPGFDPGLLTGLVFSGANRTPEPGSDDGILTAIEIAELDLRHVEMTVMSACETGLGESSGGEGVLGLQRSLQLAGCRSVVASLWKVDDRATEKLMEQFYENVWQRKLGKLEALRQAQIAMLRNYDWQTGTLRGVTRPLQTTRPGEFSHTPPAFWAAFVLSGDWR